MTRTRSPAMWLAASLALAILAGCGDDDGAVRSDALPASVTDAPAPVGHPVPLPTPDAAADTAALVGTFEADGTRVELQRDGRYRLRVGESGDDAGSEGLWSLETGSGQLLLVPHAVDEPRRRYSLPSVDELAPESGAPSLRRVGAPAPR